MSTEHNFESPILDLTSLLDVALTVLVFFMMIVPAAENSDFKAQGKESSVSSELVIELDGEKIMVKGREVAFDEVPNLLNNFKAGDDGGIVDVTINVCKDAVFGKVAGLANLVGESEKVRSVDLSVKES